MKYAVLLCDPQWNIEKMLHQSADAQLPPAASLPQLLADPAPLARNDLFEGRTQRFLLLTLKDGTQVPAFLCSYTTSILVFLVHICSEADFIEFSHLYAQDIAWADQTLQDYQDEYYRISQINNQLINSQRALMKSNLRYRQLLDEIQDANNLIALLEQDELTALLRASALYKHANERMTAGKGQSFELLVIDLEPLKQINELFGRKAGDRLLQDFALFLLGLDESGQGLFARSQCGCAARSAGVPPWPTASLLLKRCRTAPALRWKPCGAALSPARPFTTKRCTSSCCCSTAFWITYRARCSAGSSSSIYSPKSA